MSPVRYYWLIVMPTGEKAMKSCLRNIQFPSLSKENSLKKTVFTSFTVNKHKKKKSFFFILLWTSDTASTGSIPSEWERDFRPVCGIDGHHEYWENFVAVIPVKKFQNGWECHVHQMLPDTYWIWVSTALWHVNLRWAFTKPKTV